MQLGAILSALSTVATVSGAAFTTVDRSVSRFGENVGSVLSLLGNLGDSLDDIQDIASNASAAFTKWPFIDQFIQSMTSTERQLTKLKTSMQDYKGAIDEYQRAVRFAAETPFAVGEVVAAAASLRTFEFKPFDIPNIQKDGRKLIEVLGDMAGSMGLTIQEAAHALNRASVGEWEILQNRWQIGAKMIPQLKGLTSGTKEYKEAIISYLVEQRRFVGGMDLAAKSITGLVSNIEDLFSNFKTIIGGVVDAEDVLKGVTFYDKIRDNLTKMYNIVSDRAPIEAIRGLNNQYDVLGKKIETLNKGLTRQQIANKKKDEIAKLELIRQADILKTQQQRLTIEKELQRNYGRFGGQERFNKAEEYLKGKGVSNLEYTKQVPVLIQGGYDVNEIVSQYEKLQTIARVIGQMFSATYDIIFSGLTDYVARMTDNLLNTGSKFLDSFMNGAMSIENIVRGSQANLAGTTAENITQGTKEYMNLVNDYINSTVNMSSAGMKKMSEDIKKILLGTENPIIKQIMIFSVVVQLMVEFIKLKFQDLVDNSPFLAHIIELKDAFMEMLPNALKVAGNAFKKFIEENSRFFDIFLPVIQDTTLAIKDFGATLKEESFAGGGAITNNLTSAMNMFVGAMGLAIVKGLIMEKIFLNIGGYITKIFTFILSVITLLVETVVEFFRGIYEIFGFLKNYVVGGSVKEAWAKYEGPRKNWSNSVWNSGMAAGESQLIMADLLPSMNNLTNMLSTFSVMASGKGANQAMDETGETSRKKEKDKSYNAELESRKKFDAYLETSFYKDTVNKGKTPYTPFLVNQAPASPYGVYGGPVGNSYEKWKMGQPLAPTKLREDYKPYGFEDKKSKLSPTSFIFNQPNTLNPTPLPRTLNPLQPLAPVPFNLSQYNLGKQDNMSASTVDKENKVVFGDINIYVQGSLDKSVIPQIKMDLRNEFANRKVMM